MVEGMASNLVKVVLQKLANEAIKQVVRAKEIRSELKNLETTLSDIQELFINAADKEIKEVPVQKWLNSLQHLAYDIEDIFDVLATEVMHREMTKNSGGSTSMVRRLIPSCCTNFSLSSKMRHKLDAINRKLQDLEKEKVNLGLAVKNGGLEVRNNRSKDKNRVLETSVVDPSGIVGRQGDKETLVLKLIGDEPCNSKNFSIVPIVGMGGVGKTTLAKILYDDEKVKKHFDEWDTFNMSNIIYQSVTGETKEFKDLNLLQEALRDQLREKLFLLVLDDVWSESSDDWELLVAPLKACAPGSKIIMTTRKEKLLRELGCGKLNHLQSLSHDDAVCLFAKHALGENNFDSHPILKTPGEGIVRKCDGLPLALIALGRLLRTKEDEVEWKEIEESEIWSFKEGGKIIPALRLSYRDLPSYLKQLFAYCSLFPKDYAFDKKDLVLLWIAKGFLHQTSPSRTTKERWGSKCFDELLSRSFFQHSPNDRSLFVMHDLMNDLATSVAGDFYFRLEKVLGKNVRKQALDKCRHMSFIYEEFVAYKKFVGIEGAKGLRTFLSVGMKEWLQSKYLSSKVLVDLLPQLPLIRVISLSGYEISEVPESIGSLRHLRYFNLSRTKIKHLPESVCNLYNLETLIVFGCSSLTNLRKSFLKLKNLRHLDIRDTPLLKDLPLGVAKLKSLQTLSKIIIGGENDFSITQIKDFENLHGKVSIEGLEKVKNAVEAREAGLSQKRLTKLEVEWSDVSDASRNDTTENDVLDALKPYNDCLKRLGIVKYLGLEFPKWVGDPSFHRLASVSIRGCKQCTSLPPLGQLQSLKELCIQDMGDVKVVGSEFFGTGHAFPSLESLSFGNMSGWEVWSANNRSGVGDYVFPCLQVLNVQGCPNLVEVSVEALPSLRVLKIEECGNGVVSLGEKDDEEYNYGSNLLTSLRLLLVMNCENFKHLSCPNNIEMLEINYCNSICSMGGGQKLKSVHIRKCKKLMMKEELGEGGKKNTLLINSKSMPMLEFLQIHYHPNVASIIEFGGNSTDESLFADLQLQSLTSLTDLSIHSCPSMRGLSISGLKKPISEWGPQKFPSTLDTFLVIGHF